MRRRTLLVVLAGLAVVGAVGVVVLWPKPITPGLTQESFDRVEEGMTRPEVETLLGKASSFDGGGLRVLPPSGVLPPTHPDWGIWRWDDRASLPPEDGGTAPSGQWLYVVTTAASVSFDTSGRATSKYSEIFAVREPFSISSLLWRAKRQWHRWFPE
jgi:hypothetical protein